MFDASVNEETSGPCDTVGWPVANTGFVGHHDFRLVGSGRSVCRVLLIMARITDDADNDAGEMSGNALSQRSESGNDQTSRLVGLIAVASVDRAPIPGSPRNGQLFRGQDRIGPSQSWSFPSHPVNVSVSLTGAQKLASY
ncbi:unnamed protein product [Protopolystoma xenopodis]|uniref:Uncharacterized protein n=1 Tax=Protopolystoma xenopodis TaxID=117903 RepID=A0A448XI30_9PLAT|nr:unnamed protein product [Protopolystoma xenopodis]